MLGCAFEVSQESRCRDLADKIVVMVVFNEFQQRMDSAALSVTMTGVHTLTCDTKLQFVMEPGMGDDFGGNQ